MRSSRILVGLCVVILLVFAVFFSCTVSGVGFHPVPLGQSAAHSAGVAILSADGTSPMPNPIPIPSPWLV
jgi:hypothetical protein